MYKENKNLDLTAIAQRVLTQWKENDIFNKSIDLREGSETFTFFEGPPSANGKPGIHHVLGRTIKDIFCRYKTLKGFQVKRKSGWDTHGLPVELQVEKRLGITKEAIGKSISVAQYNAECKHDVMQFKGIWEDLTEKIGYWVDLDDPYVTYETPYIETVWYLLKELHKKQLLYRGFSIQPYSPAAGTGLSSHELNQPGTYRMVKDVSCTAQFLVDGTDNEFILAWTTTPWTLPSNAALAVGKNIIYAKVETFNQYTGQRIFVIIAKELIDKYFSVENLTETLGEYEAGSKSLPYKLVGEMPGKDLIGLRYQPLLPYVIPEGDAFRVIEGDFVSTEDGTGIVHIAPTFGGDDQRVAKAQGIPPIMVTDPENPEKMIPLVDKKGRFVPEMGEFAGRYVKNYTDDPNYADVNVDICIKLKKENKAFRVEKYEHNYPHCWRTDKPILYYPLESWFIKTTAFKQRLMDLNKTIAWKPEYTGTGRFGNWLENLVDWNLSRSRYWGTPLPIWITDDGTEEKCIGSLEELRSEVAKSIETGFMMDQLTDDFDLHRPFVDDVILVSPTGKRMTRVTDVVDVWFDSGAMPYAQWHYPFENNDIFQKNFPADFIAEGVDQTRGWFFTLHTIAVMLFDDVAFKNVIANGLVLDKNGNKMSKRLGNTIDPFTTLDTYGPDATRWYMVHNAQPWDNLKFDLDGIDEVRKKLFGTLHNTHQFFALYANVDRFSYQEADIKLEDRPEIDRWILSLLNSLIQDVDNSLNNYDPTKATRLIYDFVIDQLSNWYVRLCRRRFWKGDYSPDKISAYQTLYTCLETISKLGSVFAPFYFDELFTSLNSVTGREKCESVHLSNFPVADPALIDKKLEERMWLAQKISSMGLALRKNADIKVRQPLQKILIPVDDVETKKQIELIADLILTELNIKQIEFITDTSGVLIKKLKPDFKKLGPKLGKRMKLAQAALSEIDQIAIHQFEKTGKLEVLLDGEPFVFEKEDVEFINQDIPGWTVASEDNMVVALDIQINSELEYEGLARELVNRIQKIRKNSGFEIVDHISVVLEYTEMMDNMLSQFKNYICSETQCDALQLSKTISEPFEIIDLNEINLKISVLRIN